MDNPTQRFTPSRRGLLATGLAGLVATGLAGCDPSERRATTSASSPAAASSAPTISPYGRYQTGVVAPSIPQSHVQMMVFDLPAPAALDSALVLLGGLIPQLMSGRASSVAAFDPARLTITLGLGPSVLRQLAGSRSGAPGTTDLPTFAREQLGSATQGDLLLQVCADDPALLGATCAELRTQLSSRARPSWGQGGQRGPARPDGSTRNVLGFVDGVIVPRGSVQLATDVWLSGPAPVAGGTIAVIRRIRLNIAGFLNRSVGEQERAVGRRRSDGAPLSGGEPSSDIDLEAKTPAGAYLVPVDAHARRADPKPLGLPLMLRRSYGYSNGPDDQGLLFICFQNDLHTFVATQRRIDEQDAMLHDSLTTGSSTFLILPGWSAAGRLGEGLLG
jgi:dye decolorizing peroxidase